MGDELPQVAHMTGVLLFDGEGVEAELEGGLDVGFGARGDDEPNLGG
jgi:hypothetical protein